MGSATAVAVALTAGGCGSPGASTATASRPRASVAVTRPSPAHTVTTPPRARRVATDPVAATPTSAPPVVVSPSSTVAPSRAGTAMQAVTTSTLTTGPARPASGVVDHAARPEVGAASGLSTTATCPSSDLQVSLDVQPRTGTQPADRERALVVITDLSAPVCVLDGFVGLRAIELSPDRSVAALDIDVPSLPAPVTIGPDGSAFAGIEWTSRAACPLVTALRVTSPASSGAVTAGLGVSDGSSPPHLCGQDVLVGPVSSTAEGTVDFPDSD